MELVTGGIPVPSRELVHGPAKEICTLIPTALSRPCFFWKPHFLLRRHADASTAVVAGWSALRGLLE